MIRKVFGIGLSRTGTTTLAQALNDVGVGVVHYAVNKKMLFDEHGHGSCDIPTAVYFKELDTKFPNSKFIYTIRNKEEWLTSIENYLKQKQDRQLGEWQTQNRISIYGQVGFDKKVFSTKYDEHDTTVRKYFKDRSNDLLILDICGGDSLEKLSKFIGVSNNNRKFPHKNKRKQ